jgi:stress-induced-phosphoprotein 1
MEEAQATFEAGLQVDPKDAALASGLERLRAQGRRQGAQSIATLFADPVVIAELKADPKTAGMMAQPGVEAMLADIGANPNNLNSYMQNPVLMQVLSAVISKKMGVPMNASRRDDPVATGAATPMDTGADHAATEEAAAAAQQKAAAAAAASEDEETRAKKQLQKDALAAKEQGNAAYGKREFEAALAHYSKALELDPDNIIYHLNRASVFMAQKQYDDAVKECDDAVKHGREVYADFALISKAFHRKGRAQMRMQLFDDALEVGGGGSGVCVCV